MTDILVLYEDARAANGSFGPHDLLCALVADQQRTQVWKVKERAAALPLKGVDNLLRSLSQPERLKYLAPGGAPILAVIDADRIRDHLGSPNATDAEVEDRVRRLCAEPARLTVVLLDRNVESLFQAIRVCDERYFPELVDDALAKDINARDLLLQKVACDPERHHLRDCIRRHVPSLERAIATVADALAA